MSAQLRTPGQLTLGTADPATPPWFGGEPQTRYLVEPSGAPGWSVGNPYSMEGFEAGVAYSIANSMGFQPEQVRWVKANVAHDLGAAVANTDFTIANLAVDTADSSVSFSEPYLSSSEAVVSVKGNAATSATSVAALAA